MARPASSSRSIFDFLCTATVHASASENPQQLQQRIDQAQADALHALAETEQKTDKAADEARSTWAYMREDAAAKMDEVKSKIDRRGDDIDADMAAASREDLRLTRDPATERRMAGVRRSVEELDADITTW